MDSFIFTASLLVPLVAVLSSLPLPINGSNRTRTVFRANVSRVALAVTSLPLCAFFICVCIALLRDFDGATSTHCDVPNLLPSISASIGDYTPQRYIWRTAISLHSGPRLLYAYMHNTWLKGHSQESTIDGHTYESFCKIAFICNLIEIFSLMLLTSVSSTEYFAFHEACTVLFLLMSFAYMSLVVLLFHWLPQRHRDYQSSKIKVICWLVTSISILLMLYLYWRHNKYCEPYVYTVFAFFEYIVVLTNMCFHGTAALDLKDKEIIVSSENSRTWQDV
ncbi:acyltransferase PGAP2-like [Saccoglossus kowalevskii]|uniref:Post-GPI attachment to proteins factor 2-like n=1 Tax=Saccoglossus kowalevskii TaxID=10224 RepID=A0ABM0M727_SACKO|nr:PREDICTED: post-GPI attachment to proteins factor 2-like [Saccoglossus kowalevskii]